MRASPVPGFSLIKRWHLVGRDRSGVGGCASFHGLLIAAIAVSFLFGSPSLAQQAPGAAAKQAAAAGNDFAFAFLRQHADKKENQVFSPYSMDNVFALALAGANGATREQLDRVFWNRGAEAGLHAGHRELREYLERQFKEDALPFTAANGLWKQATHPLLPAFLDLARDTYAAKTADFADSSEKTTGDINAWVSEQTHGAIPELIAPGDINKSTELVLLNAMYLHGLWASPFDPLLTGAAPFRRPKQSPIQTPMMHLHLVTRYAEDASAQCLELDFRGGHAALVVLLPRGETMGLAVLKRTLNREIWSAWLKALGRQRVQVALPRFKIASRWELPPILDKLGVHDAFRQVADFSRLDGSDGLFIAKAPHAATIEVNEKGAEAAAASSVIFAYKGGGPEKRSEVFVADHPFLFAIYEKSTGAILSLGEVQEPEVAPAGMKAEPAQGHSPEPAKK